MFRLGFQVELRVRVCRPQTESDSETLFNASKEDRDENRDNDDWQGALVLD